MLFLIDIPASQGIFCTIFSLSRNSISYNIYMTYIVHMSYEYIGSNTYIVLVHQYILYWVIEGNPW